MEKMPRILANLLLPPIIAILLLLSVLVVAEAKIPSAREIAFVLLYAYAFAAVPSIIHTIVMERFYRRGLHPTQGRAVWVSTVSGALGGLIVAIVLAVASSSSVFEKVWFYPFLGAASGAVIGLLIRTISHAPKKPNKAP
jgi:hypothetical protein